MAKPTRRDLLKVAAMAPITSKLMATGIGKSTFLNVIHRPDYVATMDESGDLSPMTASNEMRWANDRGEVRFSQSSGRLRIAFHGHGVTRIVCRWRGDLRAVQLYLGDHWERSYADLHWGSEAPNRVMPWYFLAFDGEATHGYGVRTGAGAMCFWTADSEGISLWADVRSGGVPVELGERELVIAEVVCREGRRGESAFAAAQQFCRSMCPNPRLPAAPVYGTNDWDYAYGKNSAELIAGVSGLVSELSPDNSNRPYSVIDDGWSQGGLGHGPWEGNERFGDMAAFATRLRGLGVRPGIWFRPLTPLPEMPQSMRSLRSEGVLDPTLPEVHEHIANHIRKIVGWGYEMIKHDYTTFDFLGRWGSQMESSPTRDGWKLHSSSQTNAEIITELYRTIRDAAGNSKLIGCNTVGHLAAGSHELQRIGDDTSGRSWDRTRRMGVNTLAFRACQAGSFFSIDPDIVAVTKELPWHLAQQWLDIVADSGSALFVAVEPQVIEAKHRVALKRAFQVAARTQPIGEPLDWMHSMTPRRWKLDGKIREFQWMGEAGAIPFPD
jgi:alpha-galactosidase